MFNDTQIYDLHIEKTKLANEIYRLKKEAKNQKDFMTKLKAENENLKNQISVFAKTKTIKKQKGNLKISLAGQS